MQLSHLGPEGLEAQGGREGGAEGRIGRGGDRGERSLGSEEVRPGQQESSLLLRQLGGCSEHVAQPGQRGQGGQARPNQPSGLARRLLLLLLVMLVVMLMLMLLMLMVLGSPGALPE